MFRFINFDNLIVAFLYLFNYLTNQIEAFNDKRTKKKYSNVILDNSALVRVLGCAPFSDSGISVYNVKEQLFLDNVELRNRLLCLIGRKPRVFCVL